MLNLFSTPKDVVDLSTFSHVLHGTIVTQFEEEFAHYVGAKYACSLNSATSAIFLILKTFQESSGIINVPSIIPPVVLNAILTSGHGIHFTDNVEWVGSSYVLHTYNSGYRIIDSAQRVDHDQFNNEANDNDIMLFSFYPTKPIGSCDGGMVVSNNKDIIDQLKIASMNGMTLSVNSWDRTVMYPGYKMYMNSVQAKIALNGLRNLDSKKDTLKQIRDYYNEQLHVNNTSNHLYRINVSNNSRFIPYMKNSGVYCGIHYAATHLMPAYRNLDKNPQSLPESEKVALATASIPFHSDMRMTDAEMVVEMIKRYA